MGDARTDVVVVLLMLLFGLSACSSPSTQNPSLDKAKADRERREQKSAKLYRKGAEAAREGQLDEAKQRFEETIAANPLHGRAHNDLGAIHFKQGHLYKAAEEFDAASRQLLDRPEPLYNLGLVFERAGQLHQAVEAYRRALEFSPGSPRIMENLARVYITLDTNPEETAELLRQAELRDNRPEWQRWIDLQLTRLEQNSERDGTTQSHTEDTGAGRPEVSQPSQRKSR